MVAGQGCLIELNQSVKIGPTTRFQQDRSTREFSRLPPHSLADLRLLQGSIMISGSAGLHFVRSKSSSPKLTFKILPLVPPTWLTQPSSVYTNVFRVQGCNREWEQEAMSEGVEEVNGRSRRKAPLSRLICEIRKVDRSERLISVLLLSKRDFESSIYTPQSTHEGDINKVSRIIGSAFMIRQSH
jgi:hypothetical protein